MSLIVGKDIIRLEDILRITFREEQSQSFGGLFCTIYVYLKTQDSYLTYHFHCMVNQEIIKQIKKDVAVIFTDKLAVHDLEDIVKTSRRRGYETVAKSSLFEKNKVEPTQEELSNETDRLFVMSNIADYKTIARQSLLKKLGRTPTDEEVQTETSLLKFKWEPKPVG